MIYVLGLNKEPSINTFDIHIIWIIILLIITFQSNPNKP